MRRTKTFRVWLVDRAEIVRARYKSAAMPAVGETIVVERMQLEGEGVWRKAKTKPVRAHVTRVSSGFITAHTNNA